MDRCLFDGLRAAFHPTRQRRFRTVRAAALLADPPTPPPPTEVVKDLGVPCFKAVVDVYATPAYNRMVIRKIGELVVFSTEAANIEPGIADACVLLKNQERQRRGRTIVRGDMTISMMPPRPGNSCRGGTFFDLETGSTRVLL